MENIIIMPSRLDDYFGFQAIASVASLDLCTNLIIFLNGEVISLASLNGNYNVRQREKRLSECISQIVVCLSTQAAIHTHINTCAHTDSIQHAGTSPAKHNHL